MAHLTSFSWETRLRATEHHLPYKMTQCYLPLDTDKRSPPEPQPERSVLDLPTPEADKFVSFTHKYDDWLTDVLARVWLVGDFQFGHVAAYRLRYLVRCEAHRVHVVGAQSQLLVRHDQILGDRAQTVIDVHHRQAGVRSQEAFVVPSPQRVVEYLARIVCPTADTHIETNETNWTV